MSLTHARSVATVGQAGLPIVTFGVADTAAVEAEVWPALVGLYHQAGGWETPAEAYHAAVAGRGAAGLFTGRRVVGRLRAVHGVGVSGEVKQPPSCKCPRCR